ncbi:MULTISPECIES: RelA/SpoT domain-containing protein [Sphingobium]|uniref:RelA/SpoT domain-containing protein n=1 Tax=Sphingobium psychrophilum TaxID=2728834 RepID=A0A7X9WZK3_9SPHN|nr:RelA/SpoT domain-containing protein [Sphingobium psychrophilum]NML12754.1 RelA/SpoT domain-containing protein [Sphingobium psychrophilum]
MTFEDYQQGGRGRYLALVDAVQNILRHALAQHEMVAHGLTGRAKEFASLRKKLGDREIGLDQPMDEIKDLAGCRVVFLTNSQVDAFNNTRALHENFEVLSVNVHHPVPGTDTETKLFDSTNYLVRLKPERLALTEYRQFEGLSAEIQIQTLLNHAWAEMGHDTIYKKPKLTHVGKARMAAIGERMNKVMQDHLIPAGHDFDKIAGDFGRLLRADGASEAMIATIEYADNNNELEDALETYTDLVLPHFDEPDAEFSVRLEALIDAVERSRDYPVIPIRWEHGELPGKSGHDVAWRVAQLIRSHRYFEPDRTFHALVRLYQGARKEDERRLWIEAGEELAKHNLAVWKQYGPEAQQVILDELDRLDGDAIVEARPLLVAMLAHVLSAEVGGATWRSDSVMIHQGAVRPSDVLRALRNRSIAELEQWLDAAASDAERLPILQALGKADSMPMQGGDELMLMLLEDGVRVARLILDRAPHWGLELRRGREVDALHTHYRYHVLPPTLAEKPELVEAQRALIDALLDLRDQLAADPDFMLYKTLIGHDSVHPGAWDGDHFDYEATDEWRRDCYPAIIAEVTAQTVPEWKARIDRYSDAVGFDGGHFMPMRTFLGLLAEQKPEVGLLMAEGVSEQGSYFLSDILAGLERAGRLDAALALIDRWLADGHYLSAIGDYLNRKPAPDIERLTAYVSKAIERDEQVSVVSTATIAAKWYHGAADPALIELVLIPVARYASDHRLPHWIGSFHAHGYGQILRDLTPEQADVLLTSFIDIPMLDYRAVRLLVDVGSRHPQLIIDFFGTRLGRERGESRDRFDPVPFEPHDLAKVLSPHADLLLPAVRQWYDEEPSFHEYRGGRLLKHTFPKLTDAVSEQLTDLARRGDERDLKFILKSLAPYEGDEQLYPVAMEVVDRLEPGDKLLNRVSDMLGATGVVTGEFGFVEAHARRKELIERYRDDARPRVRAYARDRARELAQHMAWEQRRAARDVAQRRRHWNEE